MQLTNDAVEPNRANLFRDRIVELTSVARDRLTTKVCKHAEQRAARAPVSERTIITVARISVLTFAFAGSAIGVGETCMATETVKYKVVTSDGPYQIRDYESSVVAVVEVSGSRSDAVNAGFRLLASYIFGDNRKKAKIPMTAPVTQLPASPRPKTTSTQDAQLPASWIVNFTMPTGYLLQDLPAPLDSRIHFAQSPAHRVAAIRFSGFWSDANLQSHEADLLQWMRTQRLMPGSAPTFAYYDPPWTPWFIRTIDVLIVTAP